MHHRPSRYSAARWAILMVQSQLFVRLPMTRSNVHLRSVAFLNAVYSQNSSIAQPITSNDETNGEKMTICESLQVLNIKDKNIGIAEVKQAYRRLMRMWHPDRFQLSEDILNATKRSQKINNAYEILTEHIKINGAVHGSEAHIQNTSSARTASASHKYANHTSTSGFPDATVFEVFVESSNIVSAGYNPHTRKMYIKLSSWGSL